jgi:hypothetical protein
MEGFPQPGKKFESTPEIPRGPEAGVRAPEAIELSGEVKPEHALATFGIDATGMSPAEIRSALDNLEKEGILELTMHANVDPEDAGPSKA